MIGVFDSGHGGLTILNELAATMRRQTLVYLGDHAHAPYGDRPGPEIYELTRRSVERLFVLDCRLVILACNTASAVALRKLQQEWLPAHWPEHRILGVVVPTIEAITGVPWLARKTSVSTTPRTVGVFATPATVHSQVYPIEIAKRAPHIRVVQQACGELVRQIEAGASRHQMARTVGGTVRELAAKLGGAPLDAVVLGCTHFQLVRDLFEAELDPSVELISQPRQVALALADYLARHTHFAHARSEVPAPRLLTSGRADDVSRCAQVLLGRPSQFASV